MQINNNSSSTEEPTCMTKKRRRIDKKKGERETRTRAGAKQAEDVGGCKCEKP